MINESTGYCSGKSCYVYYLEDPRDRSIFYVGKGQGDRVFQHMKEAEIYLGQESAPTEKLDRIRDILSTNLRPRHVILRSGLDEDEALEVEAAMIDLLGIENLTNMVRGLGTDRGIREAERLYAPAQRKPRNHNFEFICQDECKLEYPTILFRMNQLFSETLTADQLYDATRGIWRVSKARANAALYGMAVSRGLVREVYEIASNSWAQFDPSAAPLQLPTRATEDIYQQSKYQRGYWFFSGKVAVPEIRDKCLMKSVKGYFTPGASNIIQYVGC